MDFLRRFMAGRYGNDQLNAALLILGLVLIVIEMLTGWGWMGMFILALLILCYFRMFSRNIQARYEENQKFLRWWGPVQNRPHALCRPQDPPVFQVPPVQAAAARAARARQDQHHLPALSYPVRPEELKWNDLYGYSLIKQ